MFFKMGIKETNNGKRGGLLKGKRHYDKDGKPLGGIKAIVTDTGKPVELEGGEVIINREASKKHWKTLSKINQSAGNGVPILPPAGATDTDPEEYKEGGNIIKFNPNHIPNKWILEYAKKIKKLHPKVWALGGNIFGNEAFENLKRVYERGYWLDSEEWMYIKWRSYVARHKKDFRIEGVIAMLKWVDKVDKGWDYMKQLIEAEITKKEKKPFGRKAAEKMKQGGLVTKKVNETNFFDSTKAEFKGITPKDCIEILDEYASYRRKKNKPEYINTKSFGDIKVVFESEKKNQFFASRSLSYYFVPKNGKYVIRISDHWSKSKPEYSRSNKLNCSWIRSCYWENYGEKFEYRIPSQSYSSTLIGGLCYFKDFEVLPKDEYAEGGAVTYKEKYNKRFDYDEDETHDLKEIAKDTGISKKGLQAIYNKGVGAYKTNPESVRPTVKSKEQWAMGRVYSAVMGGKAARIDAKELKMANGGLIAPNGKQSNLTPEQYKLVRTPEFKAWFGDWENDPENASKVVDENGEPLICEHRTTFEFNIFNKTKAGTKTDSGYFGKGFYFSPKGKGNKVYGDKTLYCFLNIKNPKYIKSYELEPDNLTNAIVIKGDYDFIENKKIPEKESKEIQEFVVFEPTQIKLADGSNTTFDATNPDIRYATGGMFGNNCIEYINSHEAVLNNGYYCIFKNTDLYVGANDKQVPKIKSFCLVSYNSGGQKNLKVTDTINPTGLSGKLQKLIGGEKPVSQVIILEFIQKARRITKSDLAEIAGGNIIIAKRDTIECHNLTANKMDEGGGVDDFDWESLYNPSPEEQKIRDEEYKKSLEQEKEDWYKKSKFSKKWAATYQDAVSRTVKEYLDAKATYDDWSSRQYKSNKGTVFLGGDDVFGEQRSIGSINEGRRQRVLRGSKMVMDESIETLKELGLNSEEITNLIEPKDEYKNGGELAKGIKAEQEHISTAEKLYSHKITPKQAAESIAKEHLEEDPHYYTKLYEMESKFANGGGVSDYSLNTPTNEKSKLTYLQQILVRTAAFKQWFGDWEKAARYFLMDNRENFKKHYENVSKVIDMVTLEPKLVYHGTRTEKEFFTFDTTKEKGIGRPYAYFAHNIEYSENFTTSSQRGHADAVPILYKTFLNIRNPFRAEGHQYEHKRRTAEDWLYIITGTIAWDKYGTQEKTEQTKKLEKAINTQIEKHVKRVSPQDAEVPFWMYMAADIKSEFKFFLISYGYDGIFYGEEISAVYEETDPSQYTKAITVFSAKDIKLGDGRNLNFNPMETDIRYKDGGAIEQETTPEVSKKDKLGALLFGDKYAKGGEIKAEKSEHIETILQPKKQETKSEARKFADELTEKMKK